MRRICQLSSIFPKMDLDNVFWDGKKAGTQRTAKNAKKNVGN
jgi:hypothetical protein